MTVLAASSLIVVKSDITVLADSSLIVVKVIILITELDSAPLSLYDPSTLTF